MQCCLLCSLVQVASVPRSDEESGAKASSRARRASESDTVFEVAHDKNVDILQMLSKAQDEYDKVWIVLCFVHFRQFDFY